MCWMISKRDTALAALLGLSLAGAATAQAPTTQTSPAAAAAAVAPKPSKQRVSGPITITAKNGEWQDGVMIYTGDVVMISRTLELRGARLELQQTGGKKNPYEISITGSPATLKHLGNTAEDAVVNGYANKMIYRSASQTIQLTGTAHLEREKDELNGEDIRYDVANRRVQASGGENGQVRIVIDVPEQAP